MVEAIVAHKRLAGGKFKHLIRWKDYVPTTWEPEENVDKQLRREYHAGVDAKAAADKKTAEAVRKVSEQARVAQGLNIRSRRPVPSTMTASARKQIVEDKAKASIKGGVNYHEAYEQAERDVPL